MSDHNRILVCKLCRYDRFMLKLYPREKRLSVVCVGCGEQWGEMPVEEKR